MVYKPEVRDYIRSKRNDLTAEAINIASERVATQLILLPDIINSQKLAHYMSTDGEINTQHLSDIFFKQNKQLFLPVINNGNSGALHFYEHSLNEPLINNKYNILEPNVEHTAQIAAQSLDIIIMPLVAFDEQCNRIGRGAGFYDKTLAFIHEQPNAQRPLLIGLAYEFQKIEAIKPNDWDIPLDVVVTENKVYHRL